MRPMPHRDFQHLLRRSHLQIKGNGKGRHQRRNIVVANMPPILAKVRCDAVRPGRCGCQGRLYRVGMRSEEHTSELQSLMRISYAVFCLKKKKYQYYKQMS